MKGGWKTFEGPHGPFKNQGDCIQFINTGKWSRARELSL